MGVNHRRRNIFVSQQLLHRSDILAAFQELGRNSNVSKVDGFAIDVCLTTFFTTFFTAPLLRARESAKHYTLMPSLFFLKAPSATPSDFCCPSFYRAGAYRLLPTFFFATSLVWSRRFQFVFKRLFCEHVLSLELHGTHRQPEDL